MTSRTRCIAAALLASLSLVLPFHALPFLAGGPALAREAAGAAREPSVAQSAARERQKKCGAEWRALPAADKTAQGPKWPQYYSKCVKRLKEQRA